jgi:recombination protein RecA
MANQNNEKNRLLEQAFSQIEKQFGKGAIMRFGDGHPVEPVGVIPTGSLAVDAALGIGGLPRGRVVEIFGPESSGKTTLALHVIAQAQKAGGNAAFIDAEHAMDPNYARNLGVDIDNLAISQPDTGEQALEIAEVLIRSGAVDVIVIDSVAALVPKSELEGDMGDPQMGMQARLMSQALRKLTAVISKSKTCLIFINQIRMKIGVTFGNPETTTGGNALKFYSSIRIDIRRIASLKDQGEAFGNRVRIKVVKNKMAPPFRETEVDMIFSEGISREGDIVDLGVEHNLIQKSGAWFSHGEERIGQGREAAKKFLRDYPAVCLEIENKLREKMGLPQVKGDAAEAKAPAEVKAAAEAKAPVEGEVKEVKEPKEKKAAKAKV